MLYTILIIHIYIIIYIYIYNYIDNYIYNVYTLIDWQLYSVHPFRIITLLVIQETQTRITPKWSVQDHSSNRFNIKIQVCISYAHLVSLPLPFHIAHLVHLASDGLAQHIHLGVFWASAADEAILWRAPRVSTQCSWQNAETEKHSMDWFKGKITGKPHI